jgi:hypothetical protein
MGSLTIAAMALGCFYGATLLGMFLNARLPAQHWEAESRDVAKQVMGVVATMAAIVLGLLVASANSSHERQATELTSLSADIILLDQTLALYGPSAQPLRDSVREDVRRTHDAIWSAGSVHNEYLNSPALQAAGQVKRVQLAALAADTDLEKQLKSRAFNLADNISKSRILMFESVAGIQWPLLAVLIFWLSTLFLGFGMLARFNLTVAVALFLGALSVAAAIFLILELSEPYRGILQVSDAPLRNAIAQIDR